MTEPKLPLRRQKKLDDEKIEARWTTTHPFLPFLVLEGLMSDYSLGQAMCWPHSRRIALAGHEQGRVGEGLTTRFHEREETAERTCQ